MACWTSRACAAVAAVPVGNVVQCHLSKEGPLVQDLMNNTDATYYFWKSETLVGRVNLGIILELILLLECKFCQCINIYWCKPSVVLVNRFI